MKINGREVGFLYTVEAHIVSTEFVNKNPECALARVYMLVAEIASKAWTKVNGGEPLTEDEIMNLDFQTFSKIRDEIDAQIMVDSETTVEAKPPKGKGKNEKSAGVQD